MPIVLAPHTNPRKVLDRLDRLSGSLDGTSLNRFSRPEFSPLHSLFLNDMSHREDLPPSRRKNFLFDDALDSFICRARLVKTSSTPMSLLADVSKNGQEKPAAIFFPS